MNLSKLTKEEYLFQAGLIINNSLGDVNVKNAVAPFGYSDEKLNEGLALKNEAESIYELQIKEYGDVDAAQAILEEARKTAHEIWMVNIRIARIAFKNDIQALATLELNKRRATTVSGWLKQSRAFYHALLSNETWKTAMADFGITEEKLSSGLQLVEDVATATEQVNKEKGDAQNATEQRDAKFEELHEWISDYEVIVRIALAGSPQLLEKLGIVVKS